MERWQRPKTTRRYLHPPKSERMYTLWREGKIIFSEIEVALEEQYQSLESAGIWFYDGKKGEQFDHKSTVMLGRDDGIPVHGQLHSLGELELTLEAFSPFGRTPACYFKLCISNKTDDVASETLAFSLKTAREQELVFEAPDLYASYAPKLSVWEELPSVWREMDGVLTDGVRTLRCFGDLNFEFDEARGVAVAPVTLGAGESLSLSFVFYMGADEPADYEAARHGTIADWERELCRIRADKLPPSVASDLLQMRIIKNLTVQLTQCFCRPKGERFMLARQGGLQRQVWTYESMSVLEALGRLGDFDDYIEPIIDLYFNEFATADGEIVALGIPWARTTGTALYSFAKYSLARDREFFEKYADDAYRSFCWIKRTRRAVTPGDGIVGGLFPPLRSCDAADEFQAWSFTDAFNLMGLSSLLAAFRRFGDGRAAQIEEEYTAYLGVMKGEWSRIRRERGEDFIPPHSLTSKDDSEFAGFVFRPGFGYLTYALDADLSDALALIDACTRRGIMKDGLYCKMPDVGNTPSTKENLDENGKCTVWYVCCHEYYWFKYFLRHGMRDRCADILRAAYRFAMTDETYMIERYNERDPYFGPWSPNASASGRFINMLLDVAK